MILALHNAFAAGRIKGSGLDYLLPVLTSKLQDRFCRFVDGGAGVGSTGKTYDRILTECLSEKNQQHAKITCYEPLEENFAVMTGRLEHEVNHR